MDSDGTVGDAILIIYIERNMLMQERYNIQMSFRGVILMESQTLAGASVGSDSEVEISFIPGGPLTPAQQILNAFANINFRDIFRMSVDEQNCSSWHPFVQCHSTGHPFKISIKNSNLQGSFDISLLPDTIEMLYFQNCALTGTIDFLRLPRDLKEFYVKNSQFTADLSRMQINLWPEQLKYIDFQSNDLFYGRLDCSEIH